MSIHDHTFTFQFRRGPASEWTTDNPILHAGEPGFETDTGKLKMGDGSLQWNDLDYFPDIADAIAGVASVDGRVGVVTLTDLYAAISHAHAGTDITSGTIATARLSVGTTTGTVAAGDHTHAGAGAHTHAESDVTNLVTDLAGKSATSHVHAGTDITSGTVASARLNVGTASGTVAAGDHVHAAADTTSGTFAVARIPTGTSGSTVALGNHTHPVDPAVVILSDGSTIAIDATLGERFKVVLTGDHTLGNPSGAVDGQMFLVELVQDGSGGQAVTLGNKYNDPNGYFTGQSTAAGKRDFLGFRYDSTADKFDVLAFSTGY